MDEYADQFAVSQLIAAERHWRDTKQWDQMRNTYHPDSFVRVAWFQGSGFAFVEAGKAGTVSAEFLKTPAFSQSYSSQWRQGHR